MEGALCFLGIILISNYDRIFLFFLYKLFGLKAKSSFSKILLSVFALMIGLGFFFLGIIPSMSGKNFFSKILIFEMQAALRS